MSVHEYTPRASGHRRITPGMAVTTSGPEPLDIPDEPWVAEAICPDADPEMFFPTAGQAPVARAAVDICTACPVVDDCLAWALDHNEKHGVWGGKTEDERRSIRRKRRTGGTR